jgi:hypothetical protein
LHLCEGLLLHISAGVLHVWPFDRQCDLESSQDLLFEQQCTPCAVCFEAVYLIAKGVVSLVATVLLSG